MALEPGIIPLRPLTLSDIFNGAVRYVRANPKATLGLTAAVVIISQIIALILQIGPLAATGRVDALRGEGGDSVEALVLSGSGTLVGVLVQLLAGIVLSGMLTVVVGRSIFGTSITIGETWARIRGRLLPLFGVTLLETLGLVLVFAVVIGIGIAVGVSAGDGLVGFLVALPIGLIAFLAATWLYTMLLFAPVAVVLEHKSVFAAFSRSFALVRNGFWRVLGLWLLASLVTGVIAGAIAVPFSIVQLGVAAGADASSGSIIFGSVLAAIGAVIGQIITAPFTAGVVVLLYTDRRMRAEAFDLVLRTGAAGPAAGTSTDQLWLAGR